MWQGTYGGAGADHDGQHEALRLQEIVCGMHYSGTYSRGTGSTTTGTRRRRLPPRWPGPGRGSSVVWLVDPISSSWDEDLVRQTFSPDDAAVQHCYLRPEPRLCGMALR